MVRSFYHSACTLVWNGQHSDGQEAIAQFLQRLPVSETRVESLDVQPVGVLLAALLLYCSLVLIHHITRRSLLWSRL